MAARESSTSSEKISSDENDLNECNLFDSDVEETSEPCEDVAPRPYRFEPRRVRRNAFFNSTCNHPPPGIPPGICNFVLTWRSIPHPRARKKRQFPTPGTAHRPQIRCFVYKT